ncbi:MAG TPA: glutaredoxin family protein [Candidatus Dormibacteraeota bacterium]|nr:glutaredoxin family protein [Candidatus Dormibacteraeota bacterium]
MSADRLELLTRRSCPLCETARVHLLQIASTWGLEVAEFDIDDDPDLLGQFTDRVPVVLRRGEVMAEGRFSLAQLAAALRPPPPAASEP